MIVLQILGTLLGVVILVRAIGVISKMDMRKRKEPYLAWLGFGVAYALLAVAAAGSMMALWARPVEAGDLLWLIGSGGLILFDRRRRRSTDTDADATLPPRRPFWLFWVR